MSLINQVLQELEKRHAADPGVTSLPPQVRAVRTVAVVVDVPVLDEELGVQQIVELPAVEQLVTEPNVAALDPRVLPR